MKTGRLDLKTTQVQAIREFNRFYTAKLGLLRKHHLDSGFSLTEARILYEISRRPDSTATVLRKELRLDKGYLSRLLTSLSNRTLIRQKVSNEDRRERVLSLTKRGQVEAERLDQQSEQQISYFLEQFSATDRATIADFLSHVRSLSERTRIRIQTVEAANPDLQAIVDEYMDSVRVVQRDAPGALQRIVEDPSVGVWTAYLGSELVGCVLLRRLVPIPSACEVKRLYVRPHARGRGIAAALLDALEQHAHASRFKAIYLDSKDDLIVAIRLYQKRGYEVCERYNDNPQATVFLRKLLRS